MQKGFITTVLIFGVLAVLALGVGCGKQVMEAAKYSDVQNASQAETRWLKGMIGLGVESESRFGYMLGRNIDRFDANQIAAALDSAPVDTVVTWENRTSGLEYELWLSPIYQSNGKDVRNIVLTALGTHSVKGELVSRAYRIGNGEWVIDGAYNYGMNNSVVKEM